MLNATEQALETATSEWFDDFVSVLRSHQIQLESGVASDELKKIYEPILSGDFEKMAKLNKQIAQKHFVPTIINEYLELLSPELPEKLAFDFNDSLVLVWAEIKEDDQEMEKKLILTEAKINAKYHETGFDMTSTIVEQSDNLSIPNHYKPVKN